MAPGPHNFSVHYTSRFVAVPSTQKPSGFGWMEDCGLLGGRHAAKRPACRLRPSFGGPRTPHTPTHTRHYAHLFMCMLCAFMYLLCACMYILCIFYVHTFYVHVMHIYAHFMCIYAHFMYLYLTLYFLRRAALCSRHCWTTLTWRTSMRRR